MAVLTARRDKDFVHLEKSFTRSRKRPGLGIGELRGAALTVARAKAANANTAAIVAAVRHGNPSCFES